MIDNEFISVQFDYQTKLSVTEKSYETIGLVECVDTSHLTGYYSKGDTLKKFGMVYCAGPMTKEQVLQGQS